jgi:hypothetical protein
MQGEPISIFDGTTYGDFAFDAIFVDGGNSPVPDAASTLPLLGCALVGLAAFRRRFAR